MEADAEGSDRDLEHLGERCLVACEFGPCFVHRWSGHEQTGGEVVADPFGEPSGLESPAVSEVAEGGVVEDVFDLVCDREPAAEDELPETGIGPQWERMLSAPFIVSPYYGTRCSTVIKLLKDREMALTERRFDAAGHETGESDFRFAVEDTVR